MADGTAVRAPAGLPLDHLLRRAVALSVVGATLWFAAVTAASLLAEHHWVADLVGNFRPHLAGGGLALAAAVAVLGWRRTAILPLLMALLHGSFLIGAVPTAVASTSGPSLRVITYNVLFLNRDFATSLDWLRAQDPDVIMVQEGDDAWLKPLASLADAYPYQTQAMPRGKRETAVLSRYPITSFEVIHPIGRTGKPLPNQAVRVELDVAGRKVVVYCVHPPHPMSDWEWRVRNIYHQWVAERVAAEDPDQPVIVAGDFNQTPWSPFHRRMLATGGLIDAARSSWPSPTRHPTGPVSWSWLGIPIDHVLVTPGIGVDGYTVGPDLGSDHQPVVVDLTIGSRPRN